jgi:hypothetical protein
VLLANLLPTLIVLFIMTSDRLTSLISKWQVIICIYLYKITECPVFTEQRDELEAEAEAIADNLNSPGPNGRVS